MVRPVRLGVPMKTLYSKVALVCILSVAQTACSFLFVTKATPREKAWVLSRQQDKPAPEPAGSQCSSSVVAPVLDTVLTGFQVVRTGVAIGSSDSAYEDAVLSRETDILLGIGFTGLFLASAIYGYSNTSTCRKVQARVEALAASANAKTEDEVRALRERVQKLEAQSASPAPAPAPVAPPVTAEPSPTPETTAEPATSSPAPAGE
jgi:hypothetical protein